MPQNLFLTDFEAFPHRIRHIPTHIGSQEGPRGSSHGLYPLCRGSYRAWEDPGVSQYPLADPLMVGDILGGYPPMVSEKEGICIMGYSPLQTPKNGQKQSFLIILAIFDPWWPTLGVQVGVQGWVNRGWCQEIKWSPWNPKMFPHRFRNIWNHFRGLLAL